MAEDKDPFNMTEAAKRLSGDRQAYLHFVKCVSLHVDQLMVGMADAPPENVLKAQGMALEGRRMLEALTKFLT